jgi:hypothetical protein
VRTPRMTYIDARGAVYLCIPKPNSSSAATAS